MLKKRVAAVLVVRDGIVVQSINFRKYLPVGNPRIAMEFLNQWGIDEIILLDISATRNKITPQYELIKDACSKSFVPLTIGGGICHIDHIRKLMNCGADKISLNHAAIYQPSLISEAAHIFGEQCVVVSVDAVKVGEEYFVYDYASRKHLNISPSEFAKNAQENGAGEVLINSVDRDGSYLGYDEVLINSVCATVNVPVICCGGARNAKDIADVFSKTQVSAVAAANFYHFTEHSVNISKAIIKKTVDVRMETFASYEKDEFDVECRLKKKSDKELEEMLFIRIEKEII